jgi:hypothetical protein
MVPHTSTVMTVLESNVLLASARMFPRAGASLRIVPAHLR